MNYNQIQSLRELSYALDIPIKQLTGILYGKKIENCYTTFAIAKKVAAIEQLIVLIKV